MDLLKSIQEKLLDLLERLKDIQAVRSFSLVIEFEDVTDIAKPTLIEIDETLNKCLGKLIPKPRRAEIRNIITKLVKKKNIETRKDDPEMMLKSPERIDVFYCTHCNVNFELKSDLEIHLKIHDKKRNIPFSCKTCGKEFETESDLDSHVISHKKEKTEIIEKAETSEEKSSCQHCSRNFSSLKKLKTHLKTHKEEANKCSICSDVFKKKKLLEIHKLSHEAKSFTCRLCPLKFTISGELDSHVEEMHEVSKKKFTCVECNMNFDNKGSLRTHMKSHKKLPHKEETEPAKAKSFPCSIAGCQKIFEKSIYLQRHVRLKHSTKGTNTCHLCGMQFALKGRLNRHLLSHGEGKLECRFCSKRFGRGDSLKRHVSIVHIQDQSFSCRVCSKAFSLKANRDVHEENVHGGESSNIQCDTCGKVFKNKVTFNSHIKVHLARSLFCSVCGKSFLRKAHYKMHLKKKHNGFSPFQNLFDSVIADI